MKAMLSIAAGSPDTLVMKTIADPVPEPHQVIISTRVTGLNFMDTLAIQDRYQVKPPRPFAPGAECAGTVVEVGSKVKELKLGERVCAFIGYGGAQELIAVDASMVVPIPSGVSDEQAAGVIIAHGTVLYSLRTRAALKPGENLVITGASGGVGLAGIEIAKRLGARIIACASGERKLSQLRDLAVDCVIDFEADDLKEQIKAATGGKGADVVLDLTGGPRTESLVRATSWGGRYLVVGFASGLLPSPPLNIVLLKSIDVMGIHWSAWAKREPEAYRADLQWLLNEIENGSVSVTIAGRYPLQQLGEALNVIARRGAVGKFVVYTSDHSR